MNVSFGIIVEQETNGYRVIGLRNNVAIYTATRLSGTKEKAEARGKKVLAKLLREEAKSVGDYTIEEVKNEQLEMV